MKSPEVFELLDRARGIANRNEIGDPNDTRDALLAIIEACKRLDDRLERLERE